ncbi:uncharacterized protein LOC130143884 isoform X3 [Falco biarmicus]|uniref:uncharacterized protein LOC130143884 isoform X3 n=1 Tax=Falco biarmicus TaxID=345155 RepID=UPI0024BC325E|nr:uncharacterized protein LOC130143884 isoform X3 [Falco biarmicus]
MARKEPLLSALKGGVLRLREGGGPCTDTSPHLASLCQLLESILRKGLQQPAWGFRRRDYWHWLEQLPTGTSGGRPTPLSASIQQVGSCQGVRTAQGRGRHFLRLALQRKVLAAAVQQLAQTPRLLEFYDPVSSILGNEDLLEPFLSLLLVMTEMDFSLDLQNCSFLDESWLLPVCITYETVPCRALGMVLRYVDGRVFVTEVLPESQAEVDEVVLAGDILDEINGCSLRNAYNGQAGAMLQKLKGQPLSFRLLRWRWHDGEVYEPLLPYLKVLKEKEPQFQLQRGPRHRSEGEPWGLHGGRRRMSRGSLLWCPPALFSPGCFTTCATWARPALGSVVAKRCWTGPSPPCWRGMRQRGVLRKQSSAAVVMGASSSSIPHSGGFI